MLQWLTLKGFLVASGERPSPSTAVSAAMGGGRALLHPMVGLACGGGGVLICAGGAIWVSLRLAFHLWEVELNKGLMHVCIRA